MSPENTFPALGEKIRAALVEDGQRQTRAKTEIAGRLAKFAADGNVFTIESLWQDLQLLDSHLGRATVFRAVETLVDKGLLNRIEFIDGGHAYRACGDAHHHHVICTNCHRVVDIDICLPEGQLAEVGEKTDFKIDRHSLAFFGLCPDCKS